MASLLFICSKNKWRSPTAELLFKNHPLHTARSAGTSAQAKIKVSQKMIDWADEIFVMENKHRDILKKRFLTGYKKVTVLDIEDIYQFNNLQLIEIFKAALARYLD